MMYTGKTSTALMEVVVAMVVMVIEVVVVMVMAQWRIKHLVKLV